MATIPKPFAMPTNQKALLVEMERLERMTGEMNEYTAALYKLAQMDSGEVKNRIASDALSHCKGTIRGMLRTNYAASGVGSGKTKDGQKSYYKQTGALKTATVDMAVIDWNETKQKNSVGIYIQMQPNAPSWCYAAACVFRYGGVYGSRESVKEAHQSAGLGFGRLVKGGQKARRRLKKHVAALAEHGAKSEGLAYIPPKPPFFDLTAAQKAVVAEMYQENFTKIANGWIKKQFPTRKR